MSVTLVGASSILRETIEARVMTASLTSDRTQVIATLPSTVMAAAQRLKWNAIVVTSRAASRLGATGSDRVHRCPGSALRFLLPCLCTPFKTTGGLRTHRNGVEARQLAADKFEEIGRAHV